MKTKDRRFGYIGDIKRGLDFENQFIKDILQLDKSIYKKELSNKWHPVYFSLNKKVKNRNRVVIFVEPNPEKEKGFFIFINSDRDNEMEVNDELSYSKAITFVKERIKTLIPIE